MVKKHHEYPFALFATGLGTSGQLGLADSDQHEDQCNTPIGIPASVFNFEKIKSVDCGWYHSIVLTDSGSLYTCGAGYSHQSGHAYTTNIRQFKKLDPSQCNMPKLKGPVKQISCGGHHSLLLTELGKVYSFGEGREGQLGTGLKVPSSCPTEICVVDQDGEQVLFKYIAAGGYHSLLIDEKNRIWTFGKNSYGQLGLGDPMDSPDEYVLQPMLVTKVAREGKVGSANNIVFEKASAGAWHSILLTKDGKVFGCGDTQYGQCGLVQNNNPDPILASTSAAPSLAFNQMATMKSRYFYPEWISALANFRIKDVACGYFHTVFIDNSGCIFTCGWGAYGQCGNSSNQSERVPRQVLTLPGVRVFSAKCGWNHVLVVDEDATVFAFGEAKHGQLGIGNSSKFRQVETPQLLQLEYPIRQVACGRGHSLFLVGEIEMEFKPYPFAKHNFLDITIVCQ